MDLTIRINGEVIDGVTANSVKLTINNPDPLKFTEQTVSYSGTINIPRSEVNDRVFRSERFPGAFARTSPYRKGDYRGRKLTVPTPLLGQWNYEIPTLQI